MNYEIHGNSIRHLHMHLFPRHDGDPFEGQPIDGSRGGFERERDDLIRLGRYLVDSASARGG
jgi:diadenosine tetraphosphate (Ap4A) HIT family hydrolase